VHALAVSATLCCILIGAFWPNNLPLAAKESTQRFALGYLPIVAAVFNLFYLRHVLSRRRMVSACMPAWPAASFIGSSGQWTVFWITSLFIVELNLTMTALVLVPGSREPSLWRQGFAGCMVALVCIAASLASIAVVMLAGNVNKVEKELQCDVEGHSWQCTRCLKKHGSDASTHEHLDELIPNVCHCRIARD
jgi:hypothetical protein